MVHNGQMHALVRSYHCVEINPINPCMTACQSVNSCQISSMNNQFCIFFSVLLVIALVSHWFKFRWKWQHYFPVHSPSRSRRFCACASACSRPPRGPTRAPRATCQDTWPPARPSTVERHVASVDCGGHTWSSRRIRPSRQGMVEKGSLYWSVYEETRNSTTADTHS